MSNKYVLAIDQSTSGTKALLLDVHGEIKARSDMAHDQIVSDKGWVEHNPVQIYRNTIEVVKAVVQKAQIDKNDILTVGISNQRETAMIWDKITGEPVYHAIVWQCARGEEICNRIATSENMELIQRSTGLKLSPYFSAAKIAWILENVDGVRDKANRNELCCGTIDSWLVYKLTEGISFKTDFSNASRTQLFNINQLCWDKDICDLFDIPLTILGEVCDSNSNFGETDFEGFLNNKIPICAVLGDSHGALFGQGCISKGMIKATYGTGSSIMMNIGEKPVFSQHGVVTSLGWSIDGKVNYVLEGNINYAGSVIKWLVDDVKLLESPKEATELAKSANKEDTTYLVPAFSGLGAPYWESKATASLCGMTRITGRAEIVKAAVEGIAYQITDIVKAMSEDAGIEIKELRVDGGPTKNDYLMQFQSDMLNIEVQIPDMEELSAIGVGYLAGITVDFYDKLGVFDRIHRAKFKPLMKEGKREICYMGWKAAVQSILHTSGN